MSRSGRFDVKALLVPILGSLEKRLVGALLLILLCRGALQVISQGRAFRLRSESEVLRVAAGNAEQLVKAVGQFRLVTHLYLNPGEKNDGARASGELTDAAMRIGEQINALRLSGMRSMTSPVT